MVKKGLTQANTLRSNNTTSTGYGIVYADEIIGGRSVKTRKDLDNLPDWVLGEDDGLDIGTTCYVQDEDCLYIYGGNGWYKSFKFIGLPVNAWYAYTTSAGASGELKANVLDIANFIKSDDLYMDVVDSLPHPFSTIVVFNQDAEDNSAPVAYITLFASYDSRPSGGTTIVASAKVFGAITNNTFPKTPNFNNINYYEGSCKTDTSTKITNWELTGGNSIVDKVWELNHLSFTGNTIKTSEIDFTAATLQKFNNSVSDTSHNICAQYSVVDVTHNNIVGQMLLIGDSLGHMVTEILTTSATLNNGVINWNEHSDTAVNTYIRRNHVKEGGNSSIAVGSWSTWTYYSGEGQFNDFKKLVAKELNKKVNTSDVVQQTGDSTTSVMSQKAVSDNLSDLSDKCKSFAENIIFGSKYNTENNPIFSVSNYAIFGTSDIYKIGTGYAVTNKIPVSEGDKFYLRVDGLQQACAYVIYYDNGTFKKSKTTDFDGIITIDKGATHIRFGVSSTTSKIILHKIFPYYLTYIDKELEKKFDKESILQESGDAEDKVMSQKVVSDKFNDLSDICFKNKDIIENSSLFASRNTIDNQIFSINDTAIYGEETDITSRLIGYKVSKKIPISRGDIFYMYVDNIGSAYAYCLYYADGTYRRFGKYAFDGLIKIEDEAQYIRFGCGTTGSICRLMKVYPGILNFVNKSDILQELGNSSDKIVSQKAINNAINELKKTIESITTKKFDIDHIILSKITSNSKVLAFGDSITYGVSSTSQYECGNIKDENEKSYKYIDVFTKEANIRLTNMAVSGATATDNTSSNRDFMKNQIERAKTFSADYVLVAIGTNDYGVSEGDNLGSLKTNILDTSNAEYQTFYGALNSEIKLIKETWQNAKIFLITPIPRYNINNKSTKSLYWYRKAIYEIAVINQCSFINGEKLIFPSDNQYAGKGEIANILLADGLHPTSLGHKLMGEKLANLVQLNSKSMSLET